MRLSPRRWRPRQLLLTWVAYWVALTLVTLGPAIAAVLRMSQLASGHGGVSAGFADGVMSLTITETGVTTWTGSVSFLSLVLLLTGPPLLIWLVWLVGASRTNNAGDTAVRSAATRDELHAADPRIGIVDASKSKRTALEES